MISFDRFKDGKQFALTFSYDDGCPQDRRLVELFNKYGMKATFNLISSSVTNPASRGVHADELKSLYIDNGHEVACHSVNHPNLKRMRLKDQLDEIFCDRETLENITGTIIRGFAFPYGTYNDDTLKAMETSSIVYGRTVKSTGKFTVPEDFRLWNPTTHHDECESRVRYFARIAKEEPWNAGGLLYIWGHAYEFDEDNAPVGWEKFEEMLKILHGSLDNIWSTANIEIYDYVQAQRSIRISADGKILYNPTDTDVWVSCDGKPLMIGACGRVEL